MAPGVLPPLFLPVRSFSFGVCQSSHYFCGATTLSITTLIIMTHNITFFNATHHITPLSITALSTSMLSVVCAECHKLAHYTDCHYDKSRGAIFAKILRKPIHLTSKKVCYLHWLCCVKPQSLHVVKLTGHRWSIYYMSVVWIIIYF
jgi:hypothetical protein